MPYADRAEHNAARRRWYSRPENKAKVASNNTARRDWIMMRKRLGRYGLTLDQFHAKYEAQNFCCAACREYLDLSDVHVDHNHTTSQVRGLLCRGCNIGIGLLKESPAIMRSAIEYLSKWANSPTPAAEGNPLQRAA